MSRSDLSVERVRHHLKMRMLIVSRVERVAGLMARVTFTGVDLQDFVSLSFDDHVKLFFPSDPSQPLVLPSVTPDGIKFPDDAPRPQARDYTPRHFDAARQELVIDFVMHGDGPHRPGPSAPRPARCWVSAARAVPSWCRWASTGMC